MKSHSLKTAIIVFSITAFCLFGMACKSDDSPDSSLKLRYTFDNQTGDSVTASTGKQTGTLMNGAVTGTENGIPVLSLPDTGEPYFDMGQSAARIINDSDEYTVAVYFFVPAGTTTSADGRAVWTFSHADSYADGPDASISSLHFRHNNPPLQLEVNVAGQGNARSWPTSSDALVTYGKWQHFIVTHNKNTVAFYIDGNRIFTTGASTSAGQITTLSRAWIGRGRWPAVDFMNGGKYADFRIYSKALTREEIDKLGIDAALETLNGKDIIYNYQVSGLENAEGVILCEDFARFSPANSKPAARLPWFSGAPQTLEVRENDGKQCLYLETAETPAEKRRGILIKENISCESEMVIEALVKPMGDLDGMIELYLIGNNDKNMSIALRSGNFGSEKEAIAAAGDAVVNSPNKSLFSFGRWYYLHLQLYKDKTVMALLDSDRMVMWKHTFAIAASQLFDSFDIALGQELGYPGEGTWYMKAYVDYVLAAEMSQNNIEDISYIRAMSAEQKNKQEMEQITAAGITRRDAVRLERSTPEAEGVSSRAILNFMNRVRDENHEMHSVMIVKSGKVIFERWWEPYAPEYRHQLASLSKSFTSTAIGMAVDEGLLTVDTMLSDIFTDEFAQLGLRADDRVKSMTIKNLLTMSTGMESEYWGWENNILSFLSGPLIDDPGEKFRYSSIAAYMLSAAITRLTGETLVEYLDPRLFIPLGIDRNWGLDERTGVNYGGFGLDITTEDIAKFGQMLLQKGMWEGKRLVSEQWIEEAASKQISNDSGGHGLSGSGNDWGMGYGYQFWMCKPEGVFRGDGAGGQACVVIPSADMVIAITENNNNLPRVLDLMWEMLDEIKKPAAGRKAAKELASFKTESYLTLDKEAEEYPGLLTVEYEMYEKNYWDTPSAISFDFRNNDCVMSFINKDGISRSSFLFVNGQWVKAATIDSVVYNRLIANGVWKNNTFTATIWYLETMSEKRQYRFTFRDDFAVVLAERRNGINRPFELFGWGKLRNE